MLFVRYWKKEENRKKKSDFTYSWSSVESVLTSTTTKYVVDRYGID